MKFGEDDLALSLYIIVCNTKSYLIPKKSYIWQKVFQFCIFFISQTKLVVFITFVSVDQNQ